jgi:hypothetical protein
MPIYGTAAVGAGHRLGMRHRVGRPARELDTYLRERDGGLGSGPAQPDAHGAGVIQITPQTKILVAIEAVDDRNGIASWARLCEEKLQTDPFSGCMFLFRGRRGTSIGYSGL